MSGFIESGETALLFAFRIGIWLFLLVYVVFAATVLRQIKIMTETLTTGFEFYLKASGILHFVFALLVLILAFIIL